MTLSIRAAVALAVMLLEEARLEAGAGFEGRRLPMQIRQNRRDFLTSMSATGAAAVFGGGTALADEAPQEATTVRLARGRGSSQVPFAANVVPPSPEAAALAAYADIPVSLYTGIPEITIPLYELKERDLKIPIALSYHASAHKVEDQASRVGLGWSLSAGGMVTRSIRGLPDEYAPGGFLHQAAEVGEVGAYATASAEKRFVWLDAMARGCRSAEPDIYYFNFAGYSGKFQFDWDGSICIASDAKLQITPIGLNPNNVTFIEGWEIVTPDGIRFTFDIEERIFTDSIVGGEIFTNPCGEILERKAPPHAWHLAKIVSPFTNSQVTFAYTDYTQTLERWTLETQIHDGVTLAVEEFHDQERIISDVRGKYLAGISTSSGDTTIEFIPGLDRADVTGNNLRALRSIDVKDRHGKLVRSCRFEYNGSTGRLTLRSLQELSNVDAKPPFTFAYFGGRLPGPLSFEQDHWGFPNNNSAETLIPAIVVPVLFGEQLLLPGADRSSAPERLTAGMLRQITYPTGGTDEFEFEPHDYSYEQAVKLDRVQKTEPKGISVSVPTSDESGEHVDKVPFDLTDKVQLQLNSAFTYRTRSPGNASRLAVAIETSGGEEVFRLAPAERDVAEEDALRGCFVRCDYFKVLNSVENPGSVTVGEVCTTEGELCNNVASGQINAHTVGELPPGSYVLIAFGIRQNQVLIDPNDPENPIRLSNSVSATLTWEQPIGAAFTPKVQGAGVRIARITRTYGFGNPDRVRRYFYTMQVDGEEVSSGSLLESGYIYETYMTYFNAMGLGGITSEKLVRFSQNRSALGTTHGSHVGYRQVTVIDGESEENGRSIYTFTSAIEFPDFPNFEIPFAPPMSRDYQRGLLLGQVDFKARLDFFVPERRLLVRRIVNEYNYVQRSIPALKVGWAVPGDGPTGAGFLARYAVGGYTNVMGYARLKKRREELNEPAGAFVTETSYEFQEDGHKQLSIESRVSDEGVFVTEYRYPSDYPRGTSLGIDELVKQHVVGAVIEKVRFRANRLIATEQNDLVVFEWKVLIAAERNRYGLFDGKVHQTHFETAAIDDGMIVQGSVFEAVADLYEVRRIHHAFDSHGNLLEFSQPGGMVTCLIFDSVGTQLVAKVDNATRQQVFYEGFEDALQETTTGQAYTGSRCSRFVFGVHTLPANDLPRLPGDYLLSYWKKVANAPWARVERTIRNYVPGTAIATDPIDGFLDEIRLHPLNAVMTSFAHQPLMGLQTSTDANGLPTHFEYDSLGRLATVRDHRRDIRRHHEYVFVFATQDGDGGTQLSRPRHVRTYTASASGIQTVEQLISADHLKVQQSTVYLDGMARAVQTVERQGSPEARDVVRIQAYDQFGREAMSFLPFRINETDGAFKIMDPPQGALLKFYSAGPPDVAKDDAPFARTLFDESPLNRTIERGSPGEAFQPDPGGNAHTRRFEYRANVEEDNVLQWRLVNGEVRSEAVYPRGTLRVEFSVDEHDSRVGSFYDCLGRQILRSVITAADEQTRTYFVYDDRHNLAVVIPPRPVAQVTKNAADPSPPKIIDPGMLKLECYRYAYDRRNRMVEKALPGAEPVFLVYDRWDRLALTQDGNQRSDNLWKFHKYDARDRLVMSGEIAIEGTRNDVARALEEFYAPGSEELRFEVAGDNHGYSNRSFPLLDETARVDRVMYLDDYSFISTFTSPDSYAFQPELGVTEVLDRAVGQQTGSKVRVFPTGQLVSSATYYDADSRQAQTLSDDHMGGRNRQTTEYNFAGSILGSLYTHQQPGTVARFEKRRTYDHAQRLKSVWLRIDDDDPVVLCSLDYNAIGQLVRKRLHSDDEADRFAQEIDYRYNIRGWLTSINPTALTQPADTTKLFSMELIYNDELTSLSNAPQFNGNVSAVRWRNIRTDEEQAYVYKYDGLNRLDTALYQVNGPKRGAFNESTIEYDPNGNPIALSRNGFISSEVVEIDRLVYTYSGNQLRSIRDSSGRSEGFHDAGLEGDAYEYDFNGNMATDRNKGIQISYNPLNLIDEIRKEPGESVRFGFDADGRKCFREVFGAGGTSRGRLDYVGDCVFEDGVLRLIIHDEGRIVRDPEEGLWRFQYFLEDHLGNVRVAFEVRTDDSEGNTTPVNAVIYAADYYPFGLPIDGNGTEEAGGTAVKHLFGGKELQGVVGLQWYDFGARMLDPAIGRWFVLDPEAEKYRGITPYGYALNNPVRYVDPTGLSPAWGWIDSGVPPVPELLVNQEEGAVGEDPTTVEDPMTADQILGNLERDRAQYETERFYADLRAQGLDEETLHREHARLMVGGLLLLIGVGVVAELGLLAGAGLASGSVGATRIAAAGGRGVRPLTYKQGFEAGEQAAKAGKELVLGKFPANVNYVARTPGTTTLDVARPLWSHTYNAGYIRGFMEEGGKIRQVTKQLSGTYEMEIRQILTIPGAP